MRPLTFLKLGRVSNLPTVWSNTLAGAVLVGPAAFADAPALQIYLAAAALTAFYVGGMFLNDAFDAEIDAKERPSRPIPSGAAGRAEVFAWGFGLLFLGFLLAWMARPMAGVWGLALALMILLYDVLHKRTVWAPVLMGLSRFLCYLVAAAALITIPGIFGLQMPINVLAGAFGLFAYVVGLPYAAKQEAFDRVERLWPLAILAVPLLYGVVLVVQAPHAAALLLALIALVAYALLLLFRRDPGDVPRAVVTLIAGIALYDALLMAAAGAMGLSMLAVLAFGLTLVLQRVVPGT